MGLLDILTGLASAKVLLRGTDTYYRKEREREKREERRRAWSDAAAANRGIARAAKRQDAAELLLTTYKLMKAKMPYADDKDLRAVFRHGGFSDEEAQAIIADATKTDEATSLGDRGTARQGGER